MTSKAAPHAAMPPADDQNIDLFFDDFGIAKFKCVSHCRIPFLVADPPTPWRPVPMMKLIAQVTN